MSVLVMLSDGKQRASLPKPCHRNDCLNWCYLPLNPCDPVTFEDRTNQQYRHPHPLSSTMTLLVDSTGDTSNTCHLHHQSLTCDRLRNIPISHAQSQLKPLLYLVIFSLLNCSVLASGFFELQLIEGVRNSTTVHVCLKEFWNSQINFNRCTFGQRTIIFSDNNHPRQSLVKIPFSFRWIVSVSILDLHL